MIMRRQLDHEEAVEVYLELTKQTHDQVLPVHEFAKEFAEKYPHAQIKNAFAMMTSLRVIKSEAEVEKISKAIEVTGAAIKNMIDHAHAGVWENELEAHFDFVLKCNQCRHAFPSIVGSGKNATVLHYNSNNQECKDNTLVLCDLGASYQYHNADITRTFPVNGKFTDRQKQIYNIVLEANEMIIAAVKPGLTLRGLNTMVIEFYEKKLGEIGLLENGKKVSDYYGIETSAINTRSRKREVVLVRQISMFLAKKYLDMSTSKIGQYVGNRDHATVLHACKTIANLADTDKQFRTELEEIDLALQNA